MSTDLDDRIVRALTARADELTVTRPPLADVLAGTGEAAPASGGGRRRTTLLVAAAIVAVLATGAVVALRAADDGGVVDVRPADGPTTTTVPELGLAYVPEGLPAEPAEATSPDGRATVLTYGEGERVLEVTVAEVLRTSELEAALDARDTEAVVATYAAGGSAGVGTVPPTPLADELIGPAAALPDRGGLVLGDAQAGDDPLLVVVGALPEHGERVDVGLVAFRSRAEVRVAGRGLRLDEALAVLGGLDGPGLEARPRPEEGPTTAAAPLPEGTPFLRPAVTALPEGWALTSTFGLGGGLGGEDVVTDPPPAGAALSSSGYGPVAGPTKTDPDHILAPGPRLGVTVSASTPTPEQADALATGSDEDLLDAFGRLDAGLWASGGEARVVDVDGVRLMMATGVVDDSTVTGAGGAHEITDFAGFLGPDLRISGQAEGLTEEQIVAAVRSVVLIR